MPMLKLVTQYGERLLVPAVLIRALGGLPAGWVGKAVIA